ncbi:MAG: thioredoxin family protein [Bacteroidetes bacterium]|nr:thioredoxin family protein [Bacteroidota bacterium]
MKRIAACFLFILMASPLFAQITFFEGSWSEVMAKAKQENKPVMVDFWAPWCGPCRMMNNNTFKDSQVGEVMNGNFIAYKMNTDEGEGRQKGQQYNVNGIPCFVFFGPDGKEIHRAVGYHTKDQFIPVLNTVMQKMGKSMGNARPASGEAKPKTSTYPELKAQQMQFFAETTLGGEAMTAMLNDAYNLGRSHNEFELDALKKK